MFVDCCDKTAMFKQECKTTNALKDVKIDAKYIKQFKIIISSNTKNTWYM